MDLIKRKDSISDLVDRRRYKNNKRKIRNRTAKWYLLIISGPDLVLWYRASRRMGQTIWQSRWIRWSNTQHTVARQPSRVRPKIAGRNGIIMSHMSLSVSAPAESILFNCLTGVAKWMDVFCENLRNKNRYFLPFHHFGGRERWSRVLSALACNGSMLFIAMGCPSPWHLRGIIIYPLFRVQANKTKSGIMLVPRKDARRHRRCLPLFGDKDKEKEKPEMNAYNFLISQPPHFCCLMSMDSSSTYGKQTSSHQVSKIEVTATYCFCPAMAAGSFSQFIWRDNSVQSRSGLLSLASGSSDMSVIHVELLTRNMRVLARFEGKKRKGEIIPIW